MAISFAVSQWSGWSPEPSTGEGNSDPVSRTAKPDVAAIPPMLRRRLNPAGRAAASQMLRLLEHGDNPPIVYCSRHGDIERTLSILTGLADSEPLSPLDFSLAVHNAICGVVSIHRQLTANISTIAAPDGLVPVLLEAAGLLSDTTPRVICVLADTTLPAVYRQPGEQAESPFAVGFLVTRQEGTRLNLDTTGETATRRASPLAFVEYLSSSRQRLQVDHNGLIWQIEKA